MTHNITLRLIIFVERFFNYTRITYIRCIQISNWWEKPPFDLRYNDIAFLGSGLLISILKSIHHLINREDFSIFHYFFQIGHGIRIGIAWHQAHYLIIQIGNTPNTQTACSTTFCLLMTSKKELPLLNSCSIHIQNGFFHLLDKWLRQDLCQSILQTTISLRKLGISAKQHFPCIISPRIGNQAYIIIWHTFSEL